MTNLVHLLRPRVQVYILGQMVSEVWPHGLEGLKLSFCEPPSDGMPQPTVIFQQDDTSGSSQPSEIVMTGPALGWHPSFKLQAKSRLATGAFRVLFHGLHVNPSL